VDEDSRNKIASYINERMGRFKFSSLNLKLMQAWKFLIAGLALVFFGFNLFFICIQPDEY